jgi:SAM-dependent methyltransferase
MAEICQDSSAILKSANPALLMVLMDEDEIFAKPRVITDLNDCHFYHEMDIPGFGHVNGEWDLRGNEREYLAGITLKGKRVLDVGTASGHLCFYMERQGAEVIGYDLSEKESWDIIPYQRDDYKKHITNFKEHVRKINNAFWLAHGAFRSRARMVYGSVYSIPPQLGTVDISVFGNVLLHVRDPFLALENASRLTRETMVIVELSGAEQEGEIPCLRFLPDFNRCEPKTTWWLLDPKIVKNFLGILGFEKSEVTYHYQNGGSAETPQRGQRRRFYTVVGHRTQGMR